MMFHQSHYGMPVLTRKRKNNLQAAHGMKKNRFSSIFYAVTFRMA
jgi:hypothetical protein